MTVEEKYRIINEAFRLGCVGITNKLFRKNLICKEEYSRILNVRNKWDNEVGMWTNTGILYINLVYNLAVKHGLLEDKK